MHIAYRNASPLPYRWADGRISTHEPAGKQQKLGYWSDQIAPQIDAEKTRFKAVMETSGPDAVKTTLDMCTEASKVQAEVIKQLRHASR